MSYQLAKLPALHSVEKQQNVDEWKTASMHTQTYRSMDPACTGVWRTEVSQWGLGAETQWVWGQSTSLAIPPENRCRLHTRCQRGGIGREVIVERVVGWEFIISQLTREPWERRELHQRGLGQSHTRK